MVPLQAPATILKRLRELCEKVSPGHDPVHIDIEPMREFPPDNCYPNVGEMVRREGGESVFGWAIYEWPRIWHEFQFHAVWRDRNGQLRDITPRRDNEKVVLFLPSDLAYTGEHVETQWFSSTGTKEVKRIMEIQYEINDLKAECFKKHGKEVNLTGSDADRVIGLEQEKALIVHSMRYEPKRNDLCPCMSRKKFKHCCGR